MTSLVPRTVEVLVKKIALGTSNRGNDWTAESAMISSNGKGNRAKKLYQQKKYLLHVLGDIQHISP